MHRVLLCLCVLVMAKMVSACWLVVVAMVVVMGKVACWKGMCVVVGGGGWMVQVRRLVWLLCVASMSSVGMGCCRCVILCMVVCCMVRLPMVWGVWVVSWFCG